MRTRDKQIKDLKAIDWIKVGLALFPLIGVGMALSACGGEDLGGDPGWTTITDTQYGRTFRCFEQASDSPWCYEVTHTP